MALTGAGFHYYRLVLLLRDRTMEVVGIEQVDHVNRLAKAERRQVSPIVLEGGIYGATGVI